ncbi:MAG: GTPase HflX [Planctomycetes bacterium]|nr:GTPase HflX [Planctomycetota bacterium]
MAVLLPGGSADPYDPLGELRSLAKTAGAVVVDEMIAKRQTPQPALYIGTGKAQELAGRCEMNNIDTVIFDNDLSPGQIRELETATGRKVLDRSELILDIFAAHARTVESRLQVELAQLEYTYPRLRRMWTHLERVAGGASSAAGAVGGIGTRGPGEKQLEIDRRLVQKRVSRLKSQLVDIHARKKREVRSRKDSFTVCLVGYTNAGKSTLMRLLTGADVYIADQLFATLDTRTARWNLSRGLDVLLSDTVGFVRDLPHHLVASFRATLEEAICADLLIHVADASHDRVAQQIAAVEGVLADLGCNREKILLAMNKIDRLTDPAVRPLLAAQHPRAIFVSAATGAGADMLTGRVAQLAGGPMLRVVLRANCANGRLMQFIRKNLEIQSQSFDRDHASVEALASGRTLASLSAFNKDVEIVSRRTV